MTFTYPIFLWGLSALAIPIIVHLFNFRKAKRISFSNVQFLEAVKKKSSSNLKLRHLLILFCRLLFVFFLVLTFAQPIIPSQEEGLNNRSVVIYLDNSNSLSNLTDQNVSGFNELLNMANEITQLYPAEAQFKLLTNDFISTNSSSLSKAKTLEKLTEIEYSDLSRTGEEILSKIQTMNVADVKDIFILSDFQASTFGQFDLLVDSVNQYHLVYAELPDHNNIFVDTVSLSNPFLVPGQKNTIMAKIVNRGPAVNDLQIKFFINDRQSGTTSITIAANSYKEIEFEISGTLKSTNRARISFEDFPVTFDNDYYFSLNLASKIKIVEVSDLPDSPISKVFGTHELFTFHTYPLDNISYPNLESADLIVINGVVSLENGLKTQIDKQLQNGQSVLFIPATDAVNPYQISGLSIAMDTLRPKVPLNIPDINNPFFENIFEKLSDDTQMPLVSPVYQWSAKGSPLLLTKTGQPYLEYFRKEGNLYVLASSLASDITDFHRHALFVPVMHRLAELSSTNVQTLSHRTDQANISIKVDSISGEQLYQLTREDVELIPSQRIQTNALMLDMPRYLLSPGFYDLMLGQKQITTVAFNPPKRESTLTPLALNDVKERMSGVTHLNVYKSGDAKSFAQKMKEKYHQRELWKYTLILSLIFLFAESLLLRFL